MSRRKRLRSNGEDLIQQLRKHESWRPTQHVLKQFLDEAEGHGRRRPLPELGIKDFPYSDYTHKEKQSALLAVVEKWLTDVQKHTPVLAYLLAHPKTGYLLSGETIKRVREKLGVFFEAINIAKATAVTEGSAEAAGLIEKCDKGKVLQRWFLWALAEPGRNEVFKYWLEKYPPTPIDAGEAFCSFV